jgi:DNA-binding SARP family transcriptional activator
MRGGAQRRWGKWGYDMATIHIRLCGPTTVLDELGVVRTPAGVKPVRILEMLALDQGTALSKELIADRLWDGAPPPSYVGTLESYVSNIRRSLGSRGRRSALTTTSQGYLLSTEGVTVDVVEIRALLTGAARAPGRRRAAMVQRALDLRAGTLLAGDPYSLWAVEARSELGHLVTESCSEAALGAFRSGALETARQMALNAVENDPVAEPAWQTLLLALAALGRTGEALGAYAAFRAATLEHLGVEPSSVSRGIYADLLRACDDGERHDDRAELSALVRLLRQRLEGWPGVTVPDRDEHLTAVAARILAVA